MLLGARTLLGAPGIATRSDRTLVHWVRWRVPRSGVTRRGRIPRTPGSGTARHAWGGGSAGKDSWQWVMAPGAQNSLGSADSPSHQKKVLRARSY